MIDKPELVINIILTLVAIFIADIRKVVFENHTTSNEVNVKDREPFLDLIKGVSIIAVIIIHVGYFFGVSKTEVNVSFLNITNNVLRFAVPFFLITSGILAKDIRKKEVACRSFVFAKTKNILIPFIIANLFVYVIYNKDLRYFIFDLITGNTLPPYYYIIVLLQIYLIYPFIYSYRKQSWFLPLAFIISFLSFVYKDYLELMKIPFMGGYLFYFAYGMAMREHFLSKENVKVKNSWYVLIILFYLLTLILGGYYYNMLFIYAIVSFNILYAFRKPLRKAKIGLVFIFLGKYTLWIYLTHFIVSLCIYTLVKDISYGFAIKYIIVTIFSLPVSIFVGLSFDKLYKHLVNYIYMLVK
ncbi:acyltransferase [Candidatus Woesebacteria bacterium]|nr:MAG: acyltransferase [Candidatus Woesebacteria bacterium]